MIKPFRKQGGGTEENFRAQSNVENSISSLSSVSILNGVFLENISVSTTSTSIPHKLGRDYRGYIVCKNNEFSDLKIANETNKELFINLQASTSCVVSLWVF